MAGTLRARAGAAAASTSDRADVARAPAFVPGVSPAHTPVQEQGTWVDGLAYCAKWLMAVYLGFALLLFVTQRSLIFMPAGRGGPDPERSGGTVVRVPALDAAGLVGGGGSHVALFHPPPDDEAPCVVFWHGNADSIAWGGTFIGAALAAKGIGVYAIEYPGYGEAAGSPSEAAIVGASEELLKHLVAPRTQGGLGVRKGSLLLVGQSIGSAIAVRMGPSWGRQGLGMVLLSPFTSMSAMATALYPPLTPLLAVLGRWMLRDPMNTLENARELPHGIAACVVHGTSDEIVPYLQGVELSLTLRDLTHGSKLITMLGMGHNNVFSPPYRERVLDVITRAAHEQHPLSSCKSIDV